jgi:hypothetical protein
MTHRLGQPVFEVKAGVGKYHLNCENQAQPLQIIASRKSWHNTAFIRIGGDDLFVVAASAT